MAAFSKQPTRRMMEIRLGRSASVKVITDGGWPEGELWAPDNPGLRRELEVLVKVGNRLFGSESHWIEEREA